MASRKFDISQADFRLIAEKILNNGMLLPFRARGTSMSPFIRPNDEVLVTAINRTAGIGDVVLAVTADQHLLLHRVVGRHRQGFIIRGDACGKPDPEVIPPENILGRVVSVDGRGWNFHLKNPWRFLLGHRPSYFLHLRRYRFLARIGKQVMAMLRPAEIRLGP